MDPEGYLYIMSALAHQKYTISDGSFREIKHNTVPRNLFFNKRSGAVVMSPDSEGQGAAVVTGVGSNLTHYSGISYFSLYTFLAHLSRRLKVSYSDHSPSVVVVIAVVRLSTIFKQHLLLNH